MVMVFPKVALIKYSSQSPNRAVLTATENGRFHDIKAHGGEIKVETKRGGK